LESFSNVSGATTSSTRGISDFLMSRAVLMIWTGSPWPSPRITPALVSGAADGIGVTA
jgi:hypothetical protein